ncbi:transposase [Thermodesulfobacteriota bacterium]
MKRYKGDNICKINSAADVKLNMPHELYRTFIIFSKYIVNSFIIKYFILFLLTSTILNGIIILTNDIIKIFQKEITMANSKKMANDKIERLKNSGTLNPHPEKINDSFFLDGSLEFFDPNDLVQVKYEMLRSVEKEGDSISDAAKKYGFSRPSFYQAQSGFKKHGIAGLIRVRPGPKSAHKLKDEILQFIDRNTKKGEPLRSRTLAPKIKERFGIEIHPRSIERAMLRKKKVFTQKRGK